MSTAATRRNLLPANPTPMTSTRTTFLVFADDWGRHPSSAQHLFQRLQSRHDVIWVNTIGMRPPRLDVMTLTRGFQKLGQWLTPGRRIDAEAATNGPKVLNPHMWPWIRRRWERDWNAGLLRRQLEPALRNASRPVVAVTTLPISADLVGRLPVDRWVYYCVDDFSSWPGLDQQSLLKREAELLQKVDATIAVSQVLMRRLQEYGAVPQFLPHGVDLAHWRSDLARDEKSPFDDLSAPRCLFWGLADRRLDAEFLTALDRELESGSIALLGPSDQPPQNTHWRRLVQLPACSYSALPAAARQADVLIMPYIDAPVTRAMQPLKLLEYLATDRPVVVRDLPANREWADCLDLAATPEEFARLVKLRIATGLPGAQAAARAARLPAESWDGRAERFEQMLLNPLQATGGPQ